MRQLKDQMMQTGSLQRRHDGLRRRSGAVATHTPPLPQPWLDSRDTRISEINGRAIKSGSVATKSAARHRLRTVSARSETADRSSSNVVWRSVIAGMTVNAAHASVAFGPVPVPRKAHVMLTSLRCTSHRNDLLQRHEQAAGHPEQEQPGVGRGVAPHD